MDLTVKEGRFQGGKEGQARRGSLGSKHERVSGRKSSPGRSSQSWFHSKSGETGNGIGGWETKSPLIR